MGDGARWCKVVQDADYAEYAGYAGYTEYAEYADYAEYAEFTGYAEYAEYAEKLITDGAYHCPVGSIMPFFLNTLVDSLCNPCNVYLFNRHNSLFREFALTAGWLGLPEVSGAHIYQP